MSNRTSLAIALAALAVGGLAAAGCKDRTPGQPTNAPPAGPAARPTAPTPVAPTPTGGTPMGPSGPRPTIDLPSVATVSTPVGRLRAAQSRCGPRGHGRQRGATTPTAAVAIGPVAGDGVFDAAAIGNALAAARPAFERCYADALGQRPGLAGQLVLSIELGESGAPTTTNATGVDPAIAACISGVVHKLTFPAPSGVARVTSTLTLSATQAPVIDRTSGDRGAGH